MYFLYVLGKLANELVRKMVSVVNYFLVKLFLFYILTEKGEIGKLKEKND